jgi:hypothetical protein
MDAMEAPTYPPAVAFELPKAVTFKPRLSDLTIAELMTFDEAWALVRKRFPAVEEMVNSPRAKPFLTVITLQVLNQVKAFATPEEFAALDAELQQLPSFLVVAP